MPKSKKRNKRHNTSFKRQEQRYSRNVKENITWIYSAIAISLHRRYGFGKKRIMDVLTDLQKLFQDYHDDVPALIKTAYQETDLILISEQTAKELGMDMDLEGEKI